VKPIDISQSQVEGLLQQAIQQALVDICSEAVIHIRTAHEFLHTEGEEVIASTVSESFNQYDGIYRPQLENMVSNAILRAITLFCQRQSLDSNFIMTYLHTSVTTVVQQVIDETLKRYANNAADRAANTSSEDIKAAFYERVNAIEGDRQVLAQEMDAYFLPKAKEMLADGNIKALSDLLNFMPACTTRMKLAGLYAQYQHEKDDHDGNDPSCNAM
tara:strand:+ start:165730 stop:166377 length:648 start_codon:yes stop_codon:yes gene_type:complete